MFLKKLKIEPPYEPAIPLLSIYPRKMKLLPPRDICTSMFMPAIFTIVKALKQHKCPLRHEQIKKMWYKNTMEYYSALKKKEILSLATTWMKLEGIMVSEISQTEKDKYCMVSLICRILNKKQKTKKTHFLKRSNS